MPRPRSLNAVGARSHPERWFMNHQCAPWRGLSTPAFPSAGSAKVTRCATHRTLSAWGGLVVILSTLRRRWRGSMRARPARPSIAPMPRRQRGPIARASWEALLRLGQASLAEPREWPSRGKCGRWRAHHWDAMADAESDAFWEGRLKVKPSVVTTEADNASLSVRGGSLDFRDGARRLRYDPGSRCLPRSLWPDGAVSSRSRL